MKTNISIALATFAAGFAAPSALANDPLTPTTAKGVQVISIEQARGLVGTVHFFDVRLPINYGKGHVPGAVNAQYVQKSEKSEGFDPTKDSFDMTKLPKDKALPVVFYSDGPTGWKSYKAALLVSRAGYSNVKWMRDGTDTWTAKGIALE